MSIVELNKKLENQRRQHERDGGLLWSHRMVTSNSCLNTRRSGSKPGIHSHQRSLGFLLIEYTAAEPRQPSNRSLPTTPIEILQYTPAVSCIEPC